MRKTIISLALVVLIFAALPLTAFAKHGNSKHAAAAKPDEHLALVFLLKRNKIANKSNGAHHLRNNKPMKL